MRHLRTRMWIRCTRELAIHARSRELGAIATSF